MIRIGLRVAAIECAKSSIQFREKSIDGKPFHRLDIYSIRFLVDFQSTCPQGYISANKGLGFILHETTLFRSAVNEGDHALSSMA